MSALDLNFVRGKRIGYNGTLDRRQPPLKIAYDALVAAGAIMVSRPTIDRRRASPALPAGYEAHKTIDEYYKRLGPTVADPLARRGGRRQPGQRARGAEVRQRHAPQHSLSDVTPGGAQRDRRTGPTCRCARPPGTRRIDDMMNNETPADPSDDFIAILGTSPSGPQAGYPQITIPMGYNATQRRTLNVSVNGNAYDERDLIGVAYVIEQATKLRQPASEVNPSMYRCAKTVPAPPFAARGGCNPDYETTDGAWSARAPTLPFSLETESAKSLQARMTAGHADRRDADQGVPRADRADQRRRPGDAGRARRSTRTRSTTRRRWTPSARRAASRGPLHGIPVLLDDVDRRARAADDRRLDRAAELHAGGATRRSSPS